MNWRILESHCLARHSLKNFFSCSLKTHSFVKLSCKSLNKVLRSLAIPVLKVKLHLFCKSLLRIGLTLKQSSFRCSQMHLILQSKCTICWIIRLRFLLLNPSVLNLLSYRLSASFTITIKL